MSCHTLGKKKTGGVPSLMFTAIMTFPDVNYIFPKARRIKEIRVFTQGIDCTQFISTRYEFIYTHFFG